jgi:cytochrome c-type biogenesis protein CcmF
MTGSYPIADVGTLALALALLISLYTIGAAVVAVRTRRAALLVSATNSVYVVAGLTTVAVAILEWAFVTHQFRLQYVAEHTSLAQPLIYNVSALWGGQEGSLLFWAWLLAVFGVVVLVQNRAQNRELIPYIITFLAFTETFFLTLLLFTSTPFSTLGVAPADGTGLNPLLQNPGMFIHPVTQYIGYVGFTIPFAFGLAALVTGKLSDAWIRSTRRWSLVSWLFLSLGLLFGMRWAYVELGWGGYWGWDPVENAALIPWLTGTAYLHSIMIQEKRGMLKVWNLVLVMLTFILSILGTFLTRSGVVQSVHAFGVSTLGPFFLAFIAIVLFVFLYLLYTRLDQLKEENEMDSLVSREATFLLNNLILVGAAFATLWGTLFPMVSEVVTGKQVTVAAPFFNQVNGPIFFMLILLMGVCTLIGWRRASLENLARNFVRPFAVALLTAVGLFALGVREALGLIAFSTAAFVLTTILLEFYRALAVRVRQHGENPPAALFHLFARNRRRYGGYVVHLGIVCAVVGITGSTFFQSDMQQNLKPGESLTLAPYTLSFEGFSDYVEADHEVIAAKVNVFENGALIATLSPQKNYYSAVDQMTTEVAVRSTAREDLYLILAGWDKDGSATLKVIINPLVTWLWVGFGVFIAGTLIAAWPDAREGRTLARVRAREVAAAVGR